MPDEKGNDKGDEETIPETSAHAYARGDEENVKGSIPDGDKGASDVTPTGGATSGGPGREAGQDEQGEGDPAEKPMSESEDDGDSEGEKGLGSESGAAGGGNSPPNMPDPSTKGATKGTEGAL